MRKVLKSGNFNALLALSLSASLAVFGCTTNRMPGEGEPVRSPANSPASTGGTSSGTVSPYPPPMMSSATTAEPLPAVMARPANRLDLTADEAAAIMARQQNGGGRFLGYANPGMSGRGYYSDLRPSGQLANPAAINPQLTVNSSINNPAGGSVITSGAGESEEEAVAAAIANGLATNASVEVPATGPGAAVFPAGTVGVTPTTAATGFSPSAAATTAPSATLSSSAAPSAAAATSGIPTTTGTTALLGTTTAAATPITPLNSAATAAPRATASGNIRVIRSNGRTTVTNQQ